MASQEIDQTFSEYCFKYIDKTTVLVEKYAKQILLVAENSSKNKMKEEKEIEEIN